MRQVADFSDRLQSEKRIALGIGKKRVDESKIGSAEGIEDLLVCGQVLQFGTGPFPYSIEVFLEFRPVFV
jgi:hypothetical protein